MRCRLTTHHLPGLVIYRFDAPLFFANARTFRNQIRHLGMTEPRPQRILVAAEPMTDVDTTASDVLEELDLELNSNGIHLVFAELKTPVRQKIERYGLTDTIDPAHFFETITEAVHAFREAQTRTRPGVAPASFAVTPTPGGALGGGMGPVLAQLIPIALAVALSTVPITATLFILLSERRKATALPFLSGWVIGTAAGLILATLAAQALPGRPRQFASLIDSLEIVIGGALVGFGLVTLLRNRRRTQRSSWIEGIGSLDPLAALGIGLALNLRPKALLLVSAAGLAISGGPPGVDDSDTVILIVVYTAVATSTVVLPILATLFFPGRMEPRLVVAREWVSTHGPVATGVVVILVGAVVLAAGIG